MNRLYLALLSSSTILEGIVIGALLGVLVHLLGCNGSAARYWTPCPAGVGITGEHTRGSGTSSGKKGREGDIKYTENSVGGYVAFDLGVDPRTCKAYVGDEAKTNGSPQD